MNGVYWALTALALLPGNRISDFMAEEDIVAWVESCKKTDGSYGHNVHHDGCLLATLSAVQILVLLRRTDCVDADAVASCTLPSSLQFWCTSSHLIVMLRHRLSCELFLWLLAPSLDVILAVPSCQD